MAEVDISKKFKNDCDDRFKKKELWLWWQHTTKVMDNKKKQKLQ